MAVTGFVMIALCSTSWPKLKVMFKRSRISFWLTNISKEFSTQKGGYRGVITASDKALNKLHEWLTQKYFETGIGFRILANSNESGKPTYSIKLDRQRQGDEVAEVNGIKFLLDPASAGEFTNCELDYVDEPNGGFVLRKCGGNDEQNKRKGIMPATQVGSNGKTG